MLFNSLDFAWFLPIVFVLYWSLNNRLSVQNTLVLGASYFFYGWWDWKFLSLIMASTIVDYTVGHKMSSIKSRKEKKKWLYASLVFNLGLLGVFKYYGFFVDNFIEAFSLFGLQLSSPTLHIILPVGISFYTFQTLSYTIDVYKEKIKPSHNFISFAAYVSFFPQLVAGPIERAQKLLPQFYSPRKFVRHEAVDGLRQMLWGFFKKMVIADNCGVYADLMFNDPTSYNGSALALGAIFFAFQIYGDFSGYSDIAIGTAKLFGFRLMQNFAFPYFSRDIAEFWRRWHISLTTWFRDYVYIPLGGSRVTRPKVIRNVFIVFIVSGFWHGANWTFIFWGFAHAILFIPLILLGINRSHVDVIGSQNGVSGKHLLQMITTFLLVTLFWIFFRAPTLNASYEYMSGIFHPSIFGIPNFKGRSHAIVTLILVGMMLLMEWKGRFSNHCLEEWALKKSRWIRWGLYAFLIFIIGMYHQTSETPFIYFQF